jgi:hypothetical protein
MEYTEWMDEGDQLIIGIDANEDVCTGATAEFFQTRGLRYAILDKHSQSSPPATHNRNNQRQPTIDGLFVTPGLQAVAAGYSPFGVGCPSDQRVLWAGFIYTDAFGLSSTPLPGGSSPQHKEPPACGKVCATTTKAAGALRSCEEIVRSGTLCHSAGVVYIFAGRLR